MKFNFKIQQYQTDAVDSIVKVFNGQKHYDKVSYIRDLGKVAPQSVQLAMGMDDEYGEQIDLLDDTGFKNEKIDLTDEQLLHNIREIQTLNNIKLSPSLIKDLGRCSLDIEMETGTGKTYVYIKTMFELNKRYGWSKFIVVVPSIAIREGVNKSFEMTQDHFMEHYGKKARFFIYNSSNLNQLDNFSSSSGINVMIINTQAFASSLKEGGRNKESRIIYSKRDEFGSRRPIDVIKANRPIIILDEPQKMGGEVTQKALKNFNPLFSINYSATHKKQHNLVYVLDALEAYNKRLVKKIEVKGFEVKNFRGTDQYLYLESIILSSKKPPMARIELEISYQKSINREPRILGVGDNLFYISNEMEQYKEGYTISEIDPIRGTVTFANGDVLLKGDVVGDISQKDMRRIQIRETIISHFEKEENLFNMGIKTLSLFFIDEVAKYRLYDEDGNEQLGEYGKMFEQEYNSILNEYITLLDTPYVRYLKGIETADTHKGYFSIDKKTGRSIDSALKRGREFSDDISAYDLILKNKERLLSFNEPTRFIFSHSALREGWDNPNVFQICTLKHSDSSTMKRQEVGRGLRLCINQAGNRMDAESLGETVHNINKLTVIASESYKNFVGDLQKQIKEVLYDRPSKATIEYFEGKTVMVGEAPTVIDARQAKDIYRYLLKNDYIDNDDNVTDSYRTDIENHALAPLPEELVPMMEGIHTLIQGVFDDSVLDDMIDNGHETKIPENELNENFYKKEFQELWNYINHKYAYTVDFDSNELITKSIGHINDNLYVSQLQYTVSKGEQRKDMNQHEVERGASFIKCNCPIRRIIAHRSRYSKTLWQFCINAYFVCIIKVFCKTLFYTFLC
jgi:type III restriction enzyme